jgi:hypothetical protein
MPRRRVTLNVRQDLLDANVELAHGEHRRSRDHLSFLLERALSAELSERARRLRSQVALITRESA